MIKQQHSIALKSPQQGLNHWFSLMLELFLGIALVFAAGPKTTFAEDNNASLVLSSSSSTYYYHAIISYTDTVEKLYQAPIPFVQEDLTIGFISPSLEASVFYLNLGVYFHSLRQTEQRDCTDVTNWDSCPSSSLTEAAYMQVREISPSIGLNFDWLKLEAAYVSSKMTGSFFFSQRHFDLSSVSNYLTGSVITEFHVLDSLKFGLSYVATRDLDSSEDASGEVLRPHLEYNQINGFLKFVF